MKTIKEIFDDKINKDKIYNYVTNKKPKSTIKWYYPILITSLVLLIIINLPQSKQKSLTRSTDIINIYSDTSDCTNDYLSNNYIEKDININDMDLSKLFNHCDCINTNKSSTNTKINIPQANAKISYKAIYIKGYNNKDLSLYGYKINYNYSENKYLNLIISKDKIVNYSINNINNYSIINNTKTKIIKNDNKYIALLSLNDYYYTIESFDLNEDELISFLKSLIKG